MRLRSALQAAKESSSGSGRDDGGSLAGNVSATVLSIILSFFSTGLFSSILRSSGSSVVRSNVRSCVVPLTVFMMLRPLPGNRMLARFLEIPRLSQNSRSPRTGEDACAYILFLVGEGEVQPGGQDNVIFLSGCPVAAMAD